MPTDSQVQQALIFVIPPQPARTWDQLTAAEQGSQQQAILDAKGTMGSQINDWNGKGQTPQTSGANFHLDLNRFVKVQSSMKVLTRQFDRL